MWLTVGIPLVSIIIIGLGIFIHNKKNIKLMEWSTFSLAVFTFFLLLFGSMNYSKLVDSISLQTKQMSVSNKPIVYIRASNIIMPGAESKLSKDPADYSLTLVNVGKLPARNLTISGQFNLRAVSKKSDSVANQPNIPGNEFQTLQFLKDVTIYPGQELNFWIRPGRPASHEVDVLDALLTVTYRMTEVDEDLAPERLAFVFKRDFGWVAVGPEGYALKYPGSQ